MPLDLAPTTRLAPPGTQPMTPPSARGSTTIAMTTTAPVDARLEAFRAQVVNDPLSRDLWALVQRQADAVVAAAGPVEYKLSVAGMLMEPMRSVQGRVLAAGLAYRITGDAKYFDATRRELLALAALPNWSPGHFLDVGEASLAAGMGLTWLRDALSPDDRDRIAHAIVENALKESMKVPISTSGWTRGDFNWNPVCHAGLVVGALAVADREPALSKQIVDRAIDCVPAAGATYAPDGAFPEGPSYWAYGTTFYVILCEALRAARGDDAGLSEMPGFLKTADFIVHMNGPTGADFNYADYHLRRPPQPVMLWFARELRRGDLAASEAADIRAIVASGKGPPGENARHVPFELLWWDPTLAALPAAPRPMAWVAGGTHVGLAAFRSAWNDPRATYLAMKGGTPNGSHAHMDVGSFVLDADGVRWAIDLGTENYDLMRAAKIELWNYKQEGTRWSVFRCGPESHNVLRFDAALQTSAGFAPVAPAKSDGIGAAVVDLSSIYPVATTAVTRRVEMHADRSVAIADAWTAGPNDVAVTFQWMTRADVTIAGDRVTLRQSGESLALRVEASSPIAIRVDDVSAPRGPQDSPNPGVKRIVIALKTDANAKGTLTVRVTPGAE